MPVRNLDKVFQPQSVAVIGASQKNASVGGMVLKNLIHAGFPGPIYPVNPKYETLHDLRCYSSINEIDAPIDLACS